jgi:putative membrane protein
MFGALGGLSVSGGLPRGGGVMEYDLVRGLHIVAVIAWMAGMLFLPRLFAYDAEQADKPEPLRSEMRALLRLWQVRLLWIRSGHGADWSFAHQPWMVVKLLGVLALSAWHGFLAGQRKKILAGTSKYSGRFWRMTNEIPFLIAIVMVLSVTTEWTF